MGIPGSLFHIPNYDDPFHMMRYGKFLETPVGVASGPHTQLAQNIVAAWLCGARYIELKTIQTQDELTISKPCIDMQDEGYNCEWSQELRTDESFTEYLNAWIIIHILHKELGFTLSPGVIFNMSVGYNLEGILKNNVRHFLTGMNDCSLALTSAKMAIRKIYPGIDELEIPSCISNSITLSTMHGCPPEEIGKIGHYLIEEKKLHTTIKLNPTLIGSNQLRKILNNKLKFPVDVPEEAFEHDLKYRDALEIINDLSTISAKKGLTFSVKLTNTLECSNTKKVFDKKESKIYMSGRALHPISINLARMLQNDFNGKLDISFSAGADCFNISRILASGLRPVTVCSDLLKPGGYGRLWQYLDRLNRDFTKYNARSIDEYIVNRIGIAGKTAAEAALINLNRYADAVCDNPVYQNLSFTSPDIKTVRDLDYFDCIHAPCGDTCPTNQDIPGYLYHVSTGNIPEAFKTIFDTNPFPYVTGMVCDHLCQLKCTRINYDEPLQIREIKRFVAENTPLLLPSPDRGGVGGGVLADNLAFRIAIIGAGPAGLSCAWYLNLAGAEVHIFEREKVAGGMISAAIPAFRITDKAFECDIRRILDAGIHFHDNHVIGREQFERLRKEYDAVFLAAGAQQSIRMNLEGIGSAGVIDPLEFLFNARKNKSTGLGRKIVVVGGGNTAMDIARTANRLVGKDGKVILVYRRTIREMPADKGEIKAVMEEGIEIIELVTPERIISHNGHVGSLSCCRNILSGKDKNGRQAPVKVTGSEFEILCDTIIPAIGQRLAIDFADPDLLKMHPGSYKTQIDRLYIGGDALRGASTAINAIADGRKAAAAILLDLAGWPPPEKQKTLKKISIPELLQRKAIRQWAISPEETLPADRRNFNLVIDSLAASEAQAEASRCLYCDEICNVCVTVCPNLANFSYEVEPVRYNLQKAVLGENGKVIIEEEGTFSVEQPWQILNIRDLCNECGNCTTFCPSAGRPFADKPGICLSVQTLNLEEEGYYLSRLPEKDVLIYKKKDFVKTLTRSDGKFIYETDQVKAVINPVDFSLAEVSFLTPCVKEVHFSFAATMSIILKGALQLKL